MDTRRGEALVETALEIALFNRRPHAGLLHSLGYRSPMAFEQPTTSPWPFPCSTKLGQCHATPDSRQHPQP